MCLVTTTTVPALPGQPKTPADAAAMVRYDRFARVPIILAALLPLVLVPSEGHWIDELVDIASWLVFVYDFVVHRRRLVDYLGTRLGKFDLVVVVLTAPWFLVAGAHSGSIVVILRLARLVRLLIASRGAKRLLARLGSVGILAASVVFLGALVAYYAEHPTNPGFKTYKDSVWWATVTLTTVGYGDIVPETPTGRWAAVMIMITGVGVLGLLAGSLASFFRPANDDDDAEPTSPADPAVPVQQPDGLALMAAELSALRAEVSLLNQRVALLAPTVPDGRDPPPP